ncbi:MAG: electron transfer flavoprotein subunit beta/FixA family protein [Deltaproteobacteria bacterium]|nr:electron transfer flavoprotein subunit beta/FixA family protein [Deltaproteobacteria bacterium]
MKIMVCLKEVPDMETHFKLNTDQTAIDREGLIFKMNSFDECAIEEALKLKEKFKGEVVLLTLGPESAKQTIRKGLAMGVDRALHLNDPTFSGSDSYGTAKALSRAIDQEKPNLVLTGVQSEDGIHMHTGVMVAEFLKLPHATILTKLDVSQDQKTARLLRELEGGLLEEVEITLPCVLTVQSGMNIPRYPTLPGIMKAKTKEIKNFSPQDLGLTASEVGTTGAHVQTLKIFSPESDQKAEMLSGSEEEAAKTLIQKLKDEAKVL